MKQNQTLRPRLMLLLALIGAVTALMMVTLAGGQTVSGKPHSALVPNGAITCDSSLGASLPDSNLIVTLRTGVEGGVPENQSVHQPLCNGGEAWLPNQQWITYHVADGQLTVRLKAPVPVRWQRICLATTRTERWGNNDFGCEEPAAQQSTATWHLQPDEQPSMIVVYGQSDELAPAVAPSHN